MSHAWFYLSGDQAVGPLSADQLRAAVSAGLVRHDTKVRRDAGKWYSASQVPGLMPVAAEAPIAQPPAPRTAVAQPPAPRAPLPQPRMPQAPVAPAGPAAVAQRAGPAPSAAVLAPPAPAVLASPAAPSAAEPETSELETMLADRPRPLTRKRRVNIVGTGIVVLVVGVPAAIGAGMAWQWYQSGGAQAGSAARAAATAKADADPASRKAKRPDGEAKSGRKGISFGPDSFDPNAVTITLKADPRIFETDEEFTPQSKIDELVFAQLKELGIEPAKLCSDGVFVRRAYLDVIGTLPTAEEARQFLQDRDSNKRQVLIDRLLKRDEFNDFWAMKWSDLLRIKAEFPINLWPNASQAYHRWVRTAIRQNMPYDRFARELLTSCGSNFRVPQVNFYRALQSKTPLSLAKTTALTLMGARAETWPKGRLEGMAVFFSKVGYKRTAEWKEEIVYFDPGAKTPPVKAAPVAPGAASPRADMLPTKPMFPDGTSCDLPPNKDPREVFADWLITGKNPWFAPSYVNRVWSWLLGRGIVHEPDDFRDDNPPSNPKLLEWLTQDFVKSGYDMRHLFRTILNSKTYQLSPIARSTDPKAAANFASYQMRRLEAEVLIDALNQITGTTESYFSMIPEPFTWIPEDTRSMALPDGSITSSFLELFGRPPRDTGVESERNNRLTAAQRLHLLNSTHIRQKFLRGAKFQELVQATSNNRQELVEELYLTILSRRPTKEEVEVIRFDLPIDIAWVLINNDEFLFRH